MAKYEGAVELDYVRYWLELLDFEVGFDRTARADIEAQNILLPDLMTALEMSIGASGRKESSYDAIFTVHGTTDDDVHLAIVISIDPLLGICIHGVKIV